MGTESSRSRRLGGLLMWFAVLGGALSWAIHLFVGWGVDELTCAAGNPSVAGLPVRGVIGAGVVLPALVTMLALAVSWRAWRTASAARRDDDPRMERAGMLGLFALCANLLFLLIILAGGAALLVFPACER